jgi:hypothetical protein
VLAVQGLDDEYGTLEQIRRHRPPPCPAPGCWKLPACGHSPHRDQPEAVVAACQGFLAGVPSQPNRRHDHEAPFPHHPDRLAAALLACTTCWPRPSRQAQGGPDAAGYTGTFAALGTAIENGFKQYVDEQGGKLGGRSIEYVKVDDESDPSKATDNVNKLIKRDNVDVMVGTVHSGVAMAMAARPRKATPC